MSAHAAEIDAWVEGRREQIQAFLQELIRAEPEDGGFSAAGAGGGDGAAPPDAAGAARLVAETAEGLGFEVETRDVALDALRDHPAFFAGPPGRPTRAYVAARRAGRGGGRSLVLNGHVDVVPAGDRDAWSHPPFSGALVNGDVWGRGASDAKGPFTSGLFAAACAAELGLGGDLTVVAATDEELGGMSSLGSLLDGLTADAVVVCEPTDLTVAPAGRGIAAFRVTVEGRHAHAGAAFQGVNAIVKAAKIIEAIDALAGELDRRRPNDIYRDVPVAHCFNVGKVQGGSWLGGVPDSCVIDALAPVIGDEEIGEIKEIVEAEIARVAAADEWLAEHPPKVEWTAPWFDPAYTPADDPFVRLASRALERVTGTTPTIGPLLGGSDLRFYSRSFGIPGVHLGPGSMRLGHGPDELVAVDEVVLIAKALAGLIVDWCGCPCHGPAEAA